MKIKIAFIALTAAIIAFAFYVRAQETVPQTQTVLKSYFNPTGATPGTNEFNELIDTMFWYINSTYTNSLNAAMEASNAANVTAASFLLCHSNNNSGIPQSVFYIRTNNISSNTWSVISGSTLVVTNWFANPFADHFYGMNIIYNCGDSITSVTNLKAYTVLKFSLSASENDNYHGQPFPAHSNLTYCVIYQ